MNRDLQALLERSGRLDLDGVDFSAFRDEPLDHDTLRCLRYMHDVESHTVCYLRDVLVTRAHAEPAISAFLASWSFEEHWHGDAIGKVLAAHGELAGPSRVAATRRALSPLDRFRPLVYLAGSVLSRHVVTLHMTWGAVNEWTTQAGYGRLASKAGHPILSELLRRIMKQEGRHIDFDASQARDGLSGSLPARRATRLGLSHHWRPVGSSLMPGPEVAFLVDHLFGGREGHKAAARIDRQIDRLPGLDGLHLVTNVARRTHQPTHRANEEAAQLA